MCKDRINELVSICIPIYNGEEFLEESIKCAINQTYEHLEILIVDDCSTDNSNEIIKKLTNQDKRIKYFKNEKNIGLVANWNKSIQLSKGDWVKFQFQDDLMKHNAIEKMIGSLSGKKYRLVISGRSYIIPKKKKSDLAIHLNNRTLKDYINKGGVIHPVDLAKFLNSNLLSYNFIGEPIVGLIRKDLFKDYGLYDLALKQIVDFEFWLRIGLNEPFYFVMENLNQFRIHSNSQSSKNKKTDGPGPTITDRILLADKLLNSDLYLNYRKHTSMVMDISTLFNSLYKKLVLETGYFRFKKAFPNCSFILPLLSSKEKCSSIVKDLEMVLADFIKKITF